MENEKIKDGLEFLFDAHGVSADQVKVNYTPKCYLYCFLDELTEKFSMPFISPDDATAKKTVYDLISDENPSNLLFRFQKTFTLYRICSMDFENAGLKNFKRVDGVSSIYNFYKPYVYTRQMTLELDGIEKKYLSDEQFQKIEEYNEKVVNLPEYKEKELHNDKV